MYTNVRFKKIISAEVYTVKTLNVINNDTGNFLILISASNKIFFPGLGKRVSKKKIN